MPSPGLGNLILQERDIAFLRGLFECRVMTAYHVSYLYFDGHEEMTKKRLQKLKSSKLIAARPGKQFEPAVLYLLVGGLNILRERGILDLYPLTDIPTLSRRASVSEMTLRHELAVVDLKVAFHRAASLRPNTTVVEFTTWPLLNQFMVYEKLVKPDAFVRVREEHAGETREHIFYVELDRSTERLATLCNRARSYHTHHKSGRFAASQGFTSDDISKCSLRVLFVLVSPERRSRVAQHLISSSQPSLVQLGTLAEATTDPFGPIWMRPVDLRDGQSSAMRLLERKSGPERPLALHDLKKPMSSSADMSVGCRP